MKVIDALLSQWAAQCLDKAKLKAAITTELVVAPDKPTVVLWLKDILSAPPKPSARIAPLHINLRYLIFVQASSRSEANSMLEALLFSAMQDAAMDVELVPVSDAYWQALNCPPHPSFCLMMHHQYLPDATLAKPVTEPMRLQVAPTARLFGRVLVELDNKTRLPVQGANVNLANSNITTFTDENGKFQLGAIPPNPKEKILIVHYKTFSQRVAVSVSQSPVEILIQTEEN